MLTFDLEHGKWLLRAGNVLGRYDHVVSAELALGTRVQQVHVFKRSTAHKDICATRGGATLGEDGIDGDHETTRLGILLSEVFTSHIFSVGERLCVG